MPKKTKAIKIPIQLEELVHENEKEIRPIGEILLEVYKDYLELKKLAGTLSESEVIRDGTVSNIFKVHDENVSKFINELKKSLGKMKKTVEEESLILQKLKN
ncbi:MAG: hypothetical protein WCE94_06005 [Candidatus Methanoperedens sp.]